MVWSLNLGQRSSPYVWMRSHELFCECTVGRAIRLGILGHVHSITVHHEIEVTELDSSSSVSSIPFYIRVGLSRSVSYKYTTHSPRSLTSHDVPRKPKSFTPASHLWVSDLSLPCPALVFILFFLVGGKIFVRTETWLWHGNLKGWLHLIGSWFHGLI